MGVSQQAKDAYAKYKKYKKAKGYYDTVMKLIDEDTRSAEFFKQGLKGLTKLGEKIVGKGFSKHPYFAYHKTHFEALASALTASDTHYNALKALSRAIESADSTEALAAQIKDLNDRKTTLKMNYAIGISGTQQFLRDASRDEAQAEDELAGTGQTIESVKVKAEAVLEAWRAEACLLFSDSVDLMAMVDIEYRGASAAYARFTEKTKKLQQSNKSIDRVAGLAAEKKRQEEAVMRRYEKPQNATAVETVMDPSLYAQRQRDKVEAVVDVLGKVCDVAMSSDPRFPNKMAVSMGAL
jgi:tetratricopeptide (TPR) repeat protein